MASAAPPTPPVLPVALNHVHLTAEDPERELRFFTDVLGFRRDPSHRAFIWLGNVQIAVSKGEPIRTERFHIGFRMDSTQAVDALRQYLATRFVATTEPVATGSYYSCYFETPAGYAVELYADGGIPALGTLD